ncbi:MAG TPA: serine/threonine-protein kinase [Gemmatimonadaceae bacterium]
MTTCERCGTRAATAARYCLQCGTALVDPGASTMILDDEQRSPLLGALRRELGREYTVEKELGRGGMSVVFKALDLELGRAVALKVLPPELALSTALADRFKREAKLAASLDHPNIIPIHRVGQAGGLLYFSMKLIEGRGLDSMVETQGPLPVAVVLQVLRSAARALAYAHDRGIVHRDIKSANILVDHDGRVLVSDFGIARAIDDPTVTATGTVVGTPYFMSPEQCAASRIGPQSDQYSLGVVAFQLLTGLVPFHAETLPGIMHHHFYTPVPDVSQARPDAPPALIAVLRRLLAKRPEHRYATTQAMMAEIDAIPFGEPERKEAEAALRALARGAPIGRVDAGELPALRSPSPLTPIGGSPAGRARRWPRRAMLVAAGAALPLAVALALRAGRGGDRAAAEGAAVATAPVIVALSDSGAGLARSGPAERLARRTTTGTADAPRRAPSEPAATPTTPIVTAATPAPDTPTVVSTPAGTGGAAGKVRIRAFPTDATIAIDGRELGTGVVLDSIVPSGTRRLRVTAPGYVALDTTIVVVGGETTQLPRLVLAPVESP